MNRLLGARAKKEIIMKNLLVLWMALAAMCLTGCSKDNDDDKLSDGEGVITMVTEEGGWFWVESFKEGEPITIDWGDGKEEEGITLAEVDEDGRFGYVYEAIYLSDKPCLVTIKGNIKGLDCNYGNVSSLNINKCPNLVYLCCGGNNLTSLDVNRCTKLIELYCYDNDISLLDISKCTKLISLECYDNNLSSSALNRIFNDLAQGRKIWMDEYAEEWEASVSIYGNPGSKTCNRSIAENKGWKVY